jgi:hypothetical protein
MAENSFLIRLIEKARISGEKTFLVLLASSLLRDVCLQSFFVLLLSFLKICSNSMEHFL